MVFVYHNRKYWRQQLPAEWLRFFNEWYSGVSLFFVLSGFLIAYTYSHKPMQSGGAYSQYLLQRMARILPLYWLILGIYYLDPAYGSGKSTLLTWTLAHGFSDKLNLDGIAQAWSLSVEMSFYLLAPLLCLLQRKHLGYLLGALALLLAMAWGTGKVWQRVNGNPQHFFYPFSFVLNATFPGRAIEFLAGMLLATAVQRQATWITRCRYKTALGFVGMMLTIYGIGFFQKDIYSHGNERPGGLLLHHLVLPGFVVLALAGLMYERTWLQRFFASRPLLLLGNASFAFYLVHISYVNLKLKEYLLLPDHNFILLWLLSIALYLLFEKPVYELCRKLLKKIFISKNYDE
jgi:peptidoglycan/LPS O-acetylase OafA/YrhL